MNEIRNVQTKRVTGIDMKLEVVVIPVSDAERAKAFYQKLGWRLDATPAGSGVVQFTPPGCGSSVQFGGNRTTASPGSAQGLWLTVSDPQATLGQMEAAGIQVDEVYHVDATGKHSGLHPERQSYRSLAAFREPDGNRWILQEVTTRLPGGIDSSTTSFASATDLESALKRAAMASPQPTRYIYPAVCLHSSNDWEQESISCSRETS